MITQDGQTLTDTPTDRKTDRQDGELKSRETTTLTMESGNEIMSQIGQAFIMSKTYGMSVILSTFKFTLS